VANDSDSDVDMEESSAPTFSGRYCGHDLHTHAPINHLVYHLGPGQLRGENRSHMMLSPACASIWLSFTQKVAKEALKKMRIKIPGGKMVKT
jgi:hypothetical protein